RIDHHVLPSFPTRRSSDLASTSNGRSHAPQMRLTSSQTSPSVVIPRSGKPNDAFATPAPDRYIDLNPARFASNALYALIVPTTCNGDSCASALEKRSPADDFMCAPS